METDAFLRKRRVVFCHFVGKNGHKIWFVCFIRKAINDPKKTVKKLY